MHRGTAAIMSTVLAAGILVSAPLAIARNGADDGVASVAADDSTGRAGADDSGSSGGADDSASRRGGARTHVRVAGTCNRSSTAKLKLSPENGRVEVEFEVDENRNGSTWGVTLMRSGDRVLARSATTRAPSGSFEVRALIAPGTPATTVTAVARRAATGEVCRAVATLP